MPDNIVTVQQDLVNELLTNLPVGYNEAQVKLPNAPFTTPKDEKWLRVTTNLAPKENVQAGGGYKRQYGIFTIDIFTPKGTGELSALNDFNELKVLYENLNIGAAKCEEVSPNILNSNDNWFVVQADVTFYYEGA